MSVARMLQGASNMGREDYALAFDQVVKVRETLTPEIINYHLRHSVHRDYIREKSLELAEQYLDSVLVNKFPTPHYTSPYIILRSSNLVVRWIRDNAQELKSLLGKCFTYGTDDTTAEYQLLLAVCVICGGIDQYKLGTVQTYDDKYHYRPKFTTMFDTLHRETCHVVSTLLHDQRVVENPSEMVYIAGMCTSCYSMGCRTCGRAINTPYVTKKELEGFYHERICETCGTSNIVNILAPKVNPREWRVYRNKFRHIGKEKI